MRMIFGLVLILGIGLAGFAVMMARNYIGAYQAELAEARSSTERAVPTTEVFVAKNELRYGQLLEKSDVRLVRWPDASLPAGVFTDPDKLFHPNGELRSVLRAMEPGEALLEVKLTKPGQEAGITSRLQNGMLAFAIKVDVTSGVSGFLRPGDKVDIFWTGRQVSQDGKNSGEFTKLIDSGVEIIAIDQSADQDFSGTQIARNVTVAATRQQVASLAQAQSSGRLTLALVGLSDDTVAEAIEIDQNRLLGVQAAEPVAQVQEKRVCTIRTRKGAEVVEIPIPCTD